MGKVQVIGDRSGRVWPAVLRTAEESRAAGRRLVLYVPEQYTLQAERDLICDLKLPGLLDIQVISPKKLRQQVRERMGGSAKPALSESGRAMAVHRAMTEKAEELRFYRGMNELPGAVKRVEEALDELQESDLTREQLREYAESAATGAERARLADLEILWGSCAELIAEHFDDEKIAWTDMVNRLARDSLWDGVDLAVYGFDSVRPDLRELLCAVCGRVHSVRVFLTADRKDAPDGTLFFHQHRSVEQLERSLEEKGLLAEEVFPGRERPDCAEALRWLDGHLFSGSAGAYPGNPDGAIAFYSAASPWNEAENAAAALRAWHAEGIPWNRMGIALPAGSELSGMLRACLALGGIPFDYQERERAAGHPVCRTLLAALACLSDGYSTEHVITMARSGYSLPEDGEGLRLEEYARAWGIEGRRWLRPFTAGEKAEDAEALRQKLIAPVEELRGALKEAKTAAASVEAIVGFLERLQVFERLGGQEEILLEKEMYREAVVNRQVWKLLTELLEQLWTLLGDRRAAIRDLGRMLGSALEDATLAVIPERKGGVVIGEVGHLLSGRLEALVLPGMQDGLLAAPESGWLNDRERNRLEAATGTVIGMNREQRCTMRKYDYYRTLTLPEKHLLVSWSLRGEDGGALQPDGLVTELRELYPAVPAPGGLAAAQDPAEPLTPQMAADGLGPMLRDLKNGAREDLSPDWKKALIALMHSGAYGKTARRILAELLPREEKARLARETARRLFSTDRVSISRLESFAACPYRHFIDYGLRPVKQETFDFGADETGTFFHEALDRYMKRAAGEKEWPDLPEERVDGLMDEIVGELTEQWAEGPLRESAVGLWQGETYVRRIRRAARVLTRFAANSDFRTIATELSFGEGDGLPPIEMTLRDGSRVLLRGKIDRIDTWENGEGVWLRVVDNKSREKRPDAAKMAAGEQLQLMIYLKAAAQGMPGARPAGAFFFPLEDREVSTETDDPEEIEAERMKHARMHGLAAAREDVLRAMDRDLSPYSVDKVFNKDGSVSKSAPWAVEEETLRRLTDAAAGKAAELCERIRDGEIAAAPSADGQQTACRYCEYGGICHVSRGDRRELNREVGFEDIAREAGTAGGKNTLRESEK